MTTIRDVAEKVGVSTATVSRILSGDETFRASEETRQAVINAVKELGYIPYIQRRNKAVKAHRADVLSVGCITSSAFGKDQFAPSYYRIVDDLEKCFAQRNVNFQFLASELELEDEAQFQKVFSQPLDGVVYLAILKEELYRKVREIVPKGVGINSFYPDIDHVTYDKERAAEKAVTYLIEQGRKRIAYIGGPGRLKGSLLTSRRFYGYRAGLENNGRQLREEYVKNCYWLVDTCYEQAMELLSLPELPDAIICGSDSISFSVFRAIYEKGLQVPGDIAAISCEELPLSKYLSPSLTTLRVPARTIARTACDMLLKRIEGYDEEPMEIVFGSKLILRDST